MKLQESVKMTLLLPCLLFSGKHPSAHLSTSQEHSNAFIHECLDPVTLSGEGEYDLNIIKEVEITNSFMGLPLNDRKCQNEENVVDCTTRHQLANILVNCGCLPMSIGSFTNNVRARKMSNV